MGENRRAEQQVEGSNPGQTNNQGLIKKTTGEIMLTVIWDLSNQMIASLGGEVAVGLVPLVPLSLVNLNGTWKEPTTLLKKVRGTFPGM